MRQLVLLLLISIYFISPLFICDCDTQLFSKDESAAISMQRMFRGFKARREVEVLPLSLSLLA